ncbi:MAG: 1,6-anhydro-N-acetylmuramyl-L-alanine amidase AmpD [Betaproteobacteria bacterium]
MRTMTVGGPVFDADGVLRRARFLPSPNYDRRPVPGDISLLVIHSISLPPGSFGGTAIADFFRNRLDYSAHPYFETLRELQVSSHFLIARSGALDQFVGCELRAWHAGASQWRGRVRCNDFSVGIELEGTEESGYTDAQYAELAQLTVEIRKHYVIADIAAHSEIAPGRKTDPGPSFDWTRYRSSIGPE